MPYQVLEIWNDHRRLGLPFFEIPANESDLIGSDMVNVLKKDSWKNANDSLKGAFSFTDAHNMYIHTFVRKGIIYGTLFWGYMLYYFLKKLKDKLYLEDKVILGSFLSSLGFFICGIFYSNIFAFDTFVFFTIFILGVNYKYEQFDYKKDKKE